MIVFKINPYFPTTLNMTQKHKYSSTYYSYYCYFLGAFIFYILIMDEKVLVLCEKWLLKFLSNLYVLRPPESEKTVFKKVSVCL